MHLQILDLDGSVAAQASLRSVAPWDSVSTIDLRELAPALRLWSRDRTVRLARERIAALAPDGPTLHLLGSGDFHHLAAVLMERAREPVTVVHIDGAGRAFAAGERIHTEDSYKYAPAEFVALLEAAGFGSVARWQDAAGDFAVYFAR